MGKLTGRALRARRPKFSRKLFYEHDDGRFTVINENPLMTFDELRGDDLLDTRDLRRHFNCSPRTLYRWIAEWDLEPALKIGREYYFEKRAVLKWEKAHPQTGGISSFYWSDDDD